MQSVSAVYELAHKQRIQTVIS